MTGATSFAVHGQFSFILLKLEEDSDHYLSSFLHRRRCGEKPILASEQVGQRQIATRVYKLLSEPQCFFSGTATVRTWKNRKYDDGTDVSPFAEVFSFAGAKSHRHKYYFKHQHRHSFRQWFRIRKCNRWLRSIQILLPYVPVHLYEDHLTNIMCIRNYRQCTKRFHSYKKSFRRDW